MGTWMPGLYRSAVISQDFESATPGFYLLLCLSFSYVTLGNEFSVSLIFRVCKWNSSVFTGCHGKYGASVCQVYSTVSSCFSQVPRHSLGITTSHLGVSVVEAALQHCLVPSRTVREKPEWHLHFLALQPESCSPGIFCYVDVSLGLEIFGPLSLILSKEHSGVTTK